MRPSTDAEELHMALFITEKLSEGILVWLVKADHPVFPVKGKADGRKRGTGRRIWHGKPSQRNVMIDQLSTFDFQVKAFRSYFITPGIFFKFRMRNLDWLGDF